jgi:hypothetical protein
MVQAFAQSPQVSAGAPRAVEIYTLSGDDQSLLRIQRAAIEQAAAIEGYQLSEGTWKSRAILSSALETNLLLQYEHSDSAGLSLVSILVPRRGGPIRVIPVLRQGTTPFKFAYDSPDAIRAYNELFPALVIDTNNDDKLASRARVYMALSGYGAFSDRLGMVEHAVINEHGKKIASFSYRDSGNADWRFLYTPQGVLTGVRMLGAEIKPVPETRTSSTTTVPSAKPVQQTTAPATDSSKGNPRPVPQTSPYVREWKAPATLPASQAIPPA